MAGTIEYLRSFRVAGIAIFDLVASFIGAWVIEHFFLSLGADDKKIFYLSVVPVGIVAHVITGQNTFLNSRVISKEINGYQAVVAANVAALMYFSSKKFIKF